jgi:hypothetical protein
MTVKRFTLKLTAYAAYWKQRKHEAKFGIQFFRVLTVTSGATRCKNLVQAISAAEGVRECSRMFGVSLGLTGWASSLILLTPGPGRSTIWRLRAGRANSILFVSFAAALRVTALQFHSYRLYR